MPPLKFINLAYPPPYNGATRVFYDEDVPVFKGMARKVTYTVELNVPAEQTPEVALKNLAIQLARKLPS